MSCRLAKWRCAPLEYRGIPEFARSRAAIMSWHLWPKVWWRWPPTILVCVAAWALVRPLSPSGRRRFHRQQWPPNGSDALHKQTSHTDGLAVTDPATGDLTASQNVCGLIDIAVSTSDASQWSWPGVKRNINKAALVTVKTYSDVFFFLRRNSSVRILQVNFGTLDFNHLYDAQRWKFIHTTRNSCVYWSGFVELLDVQFHEAIYTTERYGALCTAHSTRADVIYRHGESMC